MLALCRAVGNDLPEPALQLSLIGPAGTDRRVATITPAGGWIGRSPGCELFIDDPERYVSLRHCRIDYADSRFWVSDQSTNGTFLNGALTPIAKGTRVPLAPGDTLRLGRFQIASAEPASDRAQDAPDVGLAFPPASSLPDKPWALAADPADPPPHPAMPVPEPLSGDQVDRLATLLADLLPNQVGDALRNDPPMAGIASMPDHALADEPEPSSAPDLFPSPPAMPRSKPAPTVTDPLLAALIDPPTTGAATTRDSDPFAAVVAELTQPRDPRAGSADQVANTADNPAAVYLPSRSGASATTALAAFWCGLGVIPPSLDASGLTGLMAEFGAALREAANGFATLLGSAAQAGRPPANPLMDGHAGLRRYVDQRDQPPGRLDDAVRDVFAAAAQREDAYITAVRAALTHALRGMTPSAVEARFNTSLRGRRQSARRAELIELMFNMENQLVELAQAQFSKELNERMRPAARKLLAYERDGSHI